MDPKQVMRLGTYIVGTQAEDEANNYSSFDRFLITFLRKTISNLCRNRDMRERREPLFFSLSLSLYSLSMQILASSHD